MIDLFPANYNNVPQSQNVKSAIYFSGKRTNLTARLKSLYINQNGLKFNAIASWRTNQSDFCSSLALANYMITVEIKDYFQRVSACNISHGKIQFHESTTSRSQPTVRK